MVLSYLTQKDTNKINLLCKHVYQVILPSVAPVVNLHSDFREWGDWLDWSKGEISRIRTSIGGEKGSFLGECLKQENKPFGRGIFMDSNKSIFGFAEGQEWAVGTQRIVFSIKKEEFKV